MTADVRQPAGCLTQDDALGKRQDPFENESHPVCAELKGSAEKSKGSGGKIHQEGMDHFWKPANGSKRNFGVFLAPLGEGGGDHVTTLQLLLKEQTG